MEIIAVANEKGGVAKTTTAISLGGALAELGHDVLLIDLDAQANLTMGLGVSPDKLRRSIADVLLSSVTLASVSRETEISGLDVVPSNSNMGLAERFLPVRNDYEYILKKAIHALSAYDYVIIDCPPSLGAVTLNALTAANRVITPTQPEYFSVYGLRSILAMIRRVRGLNPPGHEMQAGIDPSNSQVQHGDGQASNPIGTNPEVIYHILITMLDRRNRIHRTLSEQLKITFEDGLLDTIIEVDTKLRESTVAGQPITIYYPRTRSANQYRSLAQEITEYAKKETSK